MQLMPATARQYGVRNSYDPKSNLDAGVRHLKDLLSRFDLPLALAAYNAGEGDDPALRRPPAVPRNAELRSQHPRRVGTITTDQAPTNVRPVETGVYAVLKRWRIGGRNRIIPCESIF